MEPQTHSTQVHTATALGSVWWVLDALYRHGPSWQLVPPILIGFVGLIGASKGWLNDAQARRHAEDLHRARLAALRPGIEGLDPSRN